MQIQSFEPIVNEKSAVLILGTMPGLASLKAGEYYGHRDNKFWDIMFPTCISDWTCDQMVSADFEMKRKLLLDHHIALWDVLKFCDRKGSLDSDIVNQIHNDFQSFFAVYPNIKRVFFNGKAAADHFKALKFEESTMADKIFTTLQSTSPSNSTNSFLILNQWKQIRS